MRRPASPAAVLLAVLALAAGADAQGQAGAPRAGTAPRAAAAPPATSATPAAVQGAPGLRASGGPFLPYRFTRLVAEAEAGFLGAFRVFGLGWDGERHLLFEAEAGAYSNIVEAVFHLDEETRALRIEAGSPGGPLSLELDLAAEERRSGGVDPVERARRERMRALLPPPALTPRTVPLERLTLSEATADEAGRTAAANFSPPRPVAALALLAAFSLLAAFAEAGVARRRAARSEAARGEAALGEPKRRRAARSEAARGEATLGEARRGRQVRGRASIGLLVTASLAAAVGAYALLPRRALLFSAALPAAARDSAYSGSLELSRELGRGFQALRYGEAGEGLELVRIITPGGSSVPLSLVASPEDDCRFSSPPLVVFQDGAYALRSGSPLSGWVLHGSD